MTEAVGQICFKRGFMSELMRSVLGGIVIAAKMGSKLLISPLLFVVIGVAGGWIHLLWSCALYWLQVWLWFSHTLVVLGHTWLHTQKCVHFVMALGITNGLPVLGLPFRHVGQSQGSNWWPDRSQVCKADIFVT